MTEPESMTQVREEAARGKGGKAKAVIKRSKTETTSRPDAAVGSRQSQNGRQDADASTADEARDPQTIAKIQERAYALFERSGREHGHDLEHWLEAERQITGPPDRRDR